MNKLVSNARNIIIIFSLLIMFVLPPLVSLAEETSSIYRYNALENHLTYRDIRDIDTENKALIKEDMLIELEPKSIDELAQILSQQKNSKVLTDAEINRIKDRSIIATFLLGNKLGTLHFQLVQIKDQNYRLLALGEDLKSDANHAQINSQVNFSITEQKEIEDFMLLQEGRFSLFGWLIKML